MQIRYEYPPIDIPPEVLNQRSSNHSTVQLRSTKYSNVSKRRTFYVNGVAKNNLTKAAREIGIHVMSLRQRLKHDTYGCSYDYELSLQNLARGRGTPITIAGVDYPNVKAAARQLGIPYSTLMDQKNRGAGIFA